MKTETEITDRGIWDEKTQTWIRPSGTVRQGRRPMYQPKKAHHSPLPDDDYGKLSRQDWRQLAITRYERMDQTMKEYNWQYNDEIDRLNKQASKLAEALGNLCGAITLNYGLDKSRESARKALAAYEADQS